MDRHSIENLLALYEGAHGPDGDLQDVARTALHALDRAARWKKGAKRAWRGGRNLQRAIAGETMLERAYIENGNIEMVLSNSLVPHMAAELAGLVKSGPGNHVTMSARDKDRETYSVTVQRENGLTPEQRISQLLVRAEDAERRLEVSRATILAAHRASQAQSTRSEIMARTQSSTRTHRTGYLVFVFGDRYWHRTRLGAERRMARAQSWASGHI
ncbi:MAG: hypothetical protein KJ556_21860, partial [Gammaproteobacteria bacterium]|nr:hypothetical protein [Gammaproteobacteria bacterium]